MDEITAILIAIEKPLLVILGLLSGFMVHTFKSRYDHEVKVKERARKINIDCAIKIKEYLLQIDEIADDLNWDKPDYEGQSELYIKINGFTKKLLRKQREISDEQLSLLIDEFNISIRTVELLHFQGAVSFSNLAQMHSISEDKFGWDKNLPDEADQIYFNMFGKLMKYLNTRL